MVISSSPLLGKVALKLKECELYYFVIVVVVMMTGMMMSSRSVIHSDEGLTLETSAF